MKRYLICILIGLLAFNSQAQNNYIVKTEDGRRVLLKADYTWEFIDQIAPKKDTTETQIKKTTVSKQITNEPELKSIKSNCDLGLGFKEPKLNSQTQAFLKRNRSSILQLKKKVAKKENCSIEDIKLISTNETKSKGTYNFCTCNGKVAYKRNGASFFKKSNLF